MGHCQEGWTTRRRLVNTRPNFPSYGSIHQQQRRNDWQEWLSYGTGWVHHKNNKRSKFTERLLLVDRLTYLRNADKASKYIRSFCKQMKKTCGMDCVVLTCHKNQKGTIEANALSVFYPF
jgi:hypothetical protein